MKEIQIPKALHEVFGERQSLIEIIFTILFAIVGSLLIYFQLFREVANSDTWKVIIGFILIADVLAGCVANFSRGTNQYYADRPQSRLVFIAIHIHLLVIAWLLSAPFTYAIIIWAYTIFAALIVNALKGRPIQLFISATLMCSGLLILMSLPMPIWFMVTCVFFMMKVMFSFAVDHYAKHA